MRAFAASPGTPPRQLVDETITLHIGATHLQALGPDYLDAEYLTSHVDAFLDGIRIVR